jgi:hypothetical protein
VDLDKAISHYQKAVQLTDHDDPGKAIYLHKLGVSHDLCFRRLKTDAEFGYKKKFQ